MRIAFVTDVIYPYVKGGAERRVFELSKRLAASGHEIHVFGIKWWEGPSTVKQDGVTLHGVCRPMKLYAGGRRSIPEALLFGASLFFLFKEKFDVIDCNQHPYFSIFPCRLAAFLRGGRMFVTWHEVWGDYWYAYMGWKGAFGKAVEKLAILVSKHNIAVSKTTAASLPSSHIIPNGVSLEEIGSIAPSSDKYDVAFAGRLIKDKNVDMLISACASLPCSLLIIGDGPERKSLEGIAGKDVTFTGVLEGDRMLAALKSSRVFVLPSTREGFSIVTLEALACGVPVITVDHEKNAARELIRDGVNGLVVPATSEGIRDALKKLLSDEAERSAMSARCASTAKAYDWGHIITGLESIYR